MDRECTKLIQSTSGNFLPRTLCMFLQQAPSSPPCKCRLSFLQATRSLANNRGMSMLRPQLLLNTCLGHTACMRLIPSTPCNFLPRTASNGLHQAQSSRLCTGIASKMCSAEASSSLPDSCCNHHLLPRSCNCLHRTPCTCLRQAPASPHCRCSCSKLCSAQVSSSVPGSCCS